MSRSLRYQDGLIDSTSMSIAMASMPLSRFSMALAMKCSCAPLVLGITLDASSPISASDSWNRQCEWTSMVLIRLPLTFTGRRRPPACACTASNIPQLQNTIPAAPLRKFLRVVMMMCLPGRLLLIFLLWFLAWVPNANIHCAGTSPFSFSTPTASTNCVQRAMSFSTNFRNSAGF